MYDTPCPKRWIPITTVRKQLKITSNDRVREICEQNGIRVVDLEGCCRSFIAVTDIEKIDEAVKRRKKRKDSSTTKLLKPHEEYYIE